MNVLSVLNLAMKIIDIASTAIPAGNKTLDDIAGLKAKMRQFVDEDRDPTPAEFQALQAETDRLSDRLDAADKRLNNR